MHEDLHGLWPKAFTQPPISVLIKFQPVFLKKKLRFWHSDFFFSFQKQNQNLCTATCKV